MFFAGLRIGRRLMTFMWYVIALPLSILAGVWFFSRPRKPQARIYPFPERYATREEIELAFEMIAQESEKVIGEMMETLKQEESK